MEEKNCQFLVIFSTIYLFCPVYIKYRKSVELVGMLFRCTLAHLLSEHAHYGEKYEKSQVDLYVRCSSSELACS